MIEYLKNRFARQPDARRSEEWFEQEGVFEDLVREGRIPSFWDCGDVTLVVLPPEGVKQGDEYELTAGGGMEYFAPNGGPSKGFASLNEVPTSIISGLKDRKNKVLEEMGLQTS
jgi:hypothetical protein